MLQELSATFFTLFGAIGETGWLDVALKFFPFALVVELPLYLLVLLGVVRYGLRQRQPYRQREAYPSVSCVITCYSEGEDVRKTIAGRQEKVTEDGIYLTKSIETSRST